MNKLIFYVLTSLSKKCTYNKDPKLKNIIFIVHKISARHPCFKPRHHFT